MCAAVWEVAYAASRLRLKALVDKGVADSFTTNLAAQARLASGALSSMLGAISSVGSDKARRRLRPARQRRPVSHQVSPAASTARDHQRGQRQGICRLPGSARPSRIR
jgi:chloramphenicol 3-O-phosphotransferase